MILRSDALFARWTLVLATTSWLACVRVIPPGLGETSKEADARLASSEASATVTNALRAAEAADLAKDEPRPQRKAVELAVAAFTAGPPEGRSRLDRAMRGVVERLRSSTEVCEGSTLAADVEAVAGHPNDAVDLRVRAATACGTPEAAAAASAALRAAHRCPEGVKVIERAWGRAPSSSWTRLMDEVAACSDSVSLRSNLGFVPARVRDDYLELLERRRAEREQRERDARLEIAQRDRDARIDGERSASRATCSAHCSDAEGRCMASCEGRGTCISRCSAFHSTCLAGCS